MAIRTTEGEVKSLLQRNYDAKNKPNLAVRIRMANSLVNQLATRSAANGSPLPADTLKLIEANLAAHFYCTADPMAQSENFGGASASYDKRSFLEDAKALDWTGTLTGMLNPKKISIGWLGKAPSEQIPYWQRD